MQVPINPSIADIGLERYLDATAKQHNNKKYDDFVGMAETIGEPLSAVSKFKMAKEFNVTRQTIYNWLKLYERSKR